MSCLTDAQFAYYTQQLSTHFVTLRVLKSTLTKVTKDDADSLKEIAEIADGVVQDSMRILRNVAIDDSAYDLLCARIGLLCDGAEFITKKITELRQ